MCLCLTYFYYMADRSPSPLSRSRVRARSRSRSPTCRPVAPRVPSPQRCLDRLPRSEYTTPPLCATKAPGDKRPRYLSEEPCVPQLARAGGPLLALLQERNNGTDRRLTAVQAYRLYCWLCSRQNPGSEWYTREVLLSIVQEGVCVFDFQSVHGISVCEGYTLASYLASYYGLVAPGTVSGSWGVDAVSATFRILDAVTVFRAQRRATAVVVGVETFASTTLQR
jgi:hypothetical protein